MSTAATTTTALRERVIFAPNKPQFLIIESDPVLQAGRFGDQFRYFFEDNLIAWFDPPVHAAIQATGAQVGDEVAITRREIREGSRRRVEWEAQLVQDEPPEAAEMPAPPPKPPASPASTKKPAARTSSRKAQAQQPAAAAVEPEPGPTPASTAAARHMAEAIAAAVQACRWSGTQYELTWEKADIRALATTIYISLSREQHA